MSAVLSLLLLLAIGAPLDAGAAPPPATSPAPASIFGRDSALAPGGAPVQGSLDKEIIRRIIRRHIDEVKYCYEQELTKKPSLFGQIMVRFTIAASGQVIVSALQSSTMGNGRVENCTVQAVRRWQFPKPLGGGIVIISYPFVLTPGAPIPLMPASAGAGAADVEIVDLKTFVHRSTNADGVPSNGLVAVTDGGLLLVDTAWTEAQTEAILKWGDERLGRPWIGAVITHDHADRDGGLGALLRRKIPVAALDLTVAKLRKRGIRDVTTLFTARAGEFKDPRGFEAFYPGPGHTTDNIVLSFPTVLYGGCLIKSMEAKDLGFTADADLAAWPEAIRRVSERYAKMIIIPGHGPVDPTSAAYQHTLDLLAAARTK
jgi:metallo-beta-lactamase class B